MASHHVHLDGRRIAPLIERHMRRDNPAVGNRTEGQYVLQTLKGEPIVVIGLVASIIVLVAQQVLQSGIVTNAGEVQVLNLVVSIVPALLALIQRAFVTPTA